MKKAQQPIRRTDLTRSIVACHRIEDAMWREIAALGCDERSSAADIQQALTNIGPRCPSWCEQKAWDRIAEMFATWSTTCGSLHLFWRLRRKRDE